MNRSQVVPGLRQHGFVLAATLLFIMVMSLVAVAALVGNTSQERMAGNDKDLNTAFQGAEAGLRDAEAYIRAFVSDATTFDPNCGGPLCLPRTVSPQWGEYIDWNNPTNAFTYPQAGGTALTGVSQQPRYIIERIPSRSPDSLAIGIKPLAAIIAYRITSAGYGARGGAPVVLQSIYQP